MLGIPAVAPHSESIFLTEHQIRELQDRFTCIYVNFDNDSTGIQKSIEMTKEYELYYWNVPYSYTKCKDPSDMVNYYSYQDLRKALNDKFMRDKIPYRV